MASGPSAVLAPLRRLVMKAALTLASPFFAAAFLFVLLERPLAWVAVPAGVGVLVLVLGLVAWLVVRAKLRPVVDAMEQAGTFVESPRR